MRIKFLLILLLTPFSLFAKAHPIILKSKFETNVLFIQQASSATLRKSPTEPGKLQLILRGVYPKTLYISGNSKHIAGSLSLHDFLRIWEENSIQFQDSGPSAIMSYLSFKPTSQNGVETDSLELINPIYDSSSNSLVFIAVPEHEKVVKTGRFKNVVLIYDGLSISSKEMNAHYKVMPSINEKLFDQRSINENH